MTKARAVPLPRLLDENMREVCRLHPSALSAVVKLTPLSTVSITMPEGEPALMPRQWVEVLGPYGTLGIYRVSKPRRVYGQQQQANLEHGITTLGDDLTPEETTLTGTMRSIMQTLLGYQSARRWVLGDAPNTGSYTLEVNRTKVLEAVLDLLRQAPEYALSFDQTGTPWRVSVEALSASPMCECRLSRNTSNVAETLDDSSLLTRVYSAALPGGHMDGPTVGKWGVVAEDLGVADDVEQAKAVAYARELLESRKNPAVSLEVDGLYLARITGEPMDALRVGALCRVALPRYDMTADERILECRFADLLNAPERVRLTLSTQPKDTSRTLADLRRSASSLTHATIDQGERIRSHGGSITQLNVDLEKTAEYAEIVNGNLTTFKNYVGIQLDEQNAEIRLKASQESVDKLGNRVSNAEINIKGAEAAIELKASQSELDALGNRVSTAESTLTVQSDQITAQSKRINLKADKTVVDGILSAGIAGVSLLSATSVAGNKGNFDQLSINGDPVVTHSATLLKSVSISAPKTTFTDYYGDQYTVVSSVSLSTKSETIVYLST